MQLAPGGAAEPGRRRRVRGRGLRSLGPREWASCPSDPGLLGPPHLVVSSWLPDSSRARAEALRPVPALWAPHSRDSRTGVPGQPVGAPVFAGTRWARTAEVPNQARGRGGRSRPGPGASPRVWQGSLPDDSHTGNSLMTGNIFTSGLQRSSCRGPSALLIRPNTKAHSGRSPPRAGRPRRRGSPAAGCCGKGAGGGLSGSEVGSRTLCPVPLTGAVCKHAGLSKTPAPSGLCVDTGPPASLGSAEDAPGVRPEPAPHAPASGRRAGGLERLALRGFREPDLRE